MSEIGKTISPGRARALEISGGKIEPDQKYMAPDGHPAGPGAAEELAAKLPAPLSPGGNETTPKASRPFPVSKK
jgi:hypothetical protein